MSIHTLPEIIGYLNFKPLEFATEGQAANWSRIRAGLMSHPRSNIAFIGADLNSIHGAALIDAKGVVRAHTLGEGQLLASMDWENDVCATHKRVGMAGSDWTDSWLRANVPGNANMMTASIKADHSLKAGDQYNIAGTFSRRAIIKSSIDTAGEVKTATLEELATIHHKDWSANASQAQLEANAYVKPLVRFAGFDIWIENPAGSTRSGIDPTGRPWESTMYNSYGEFCCSLGVDGDKMDVYLGPNPACENVYAVQQTCRGDWDKYDEDKIMLGFDSEEDARTAYIRHYDDPRYCGDIITVPRHLFKRMILNNPTGKSVADLKQDFIRRGLIQPDA